MISTKLKRLLFPMSLPWKLDRAMQILITPVRLLELSTRAYRDTLKGRKNAQDDDTRSV